MTEPNHPTPGWYHAQGDPQGTQRYWNGSQWTGEPRPVAGQATSGGALADPWQRIGAALIDFVIFFFIGLIYGGSQLAMGTDSGSLQQSAGAAVVSVILTFGYRTLMVSQFGGTIGKLALGLRVESDARQTPPPIDVAAKRAANSLIGLLGVAMPVLSFFASIGIGIVSLVFLFSDDQHRTVMDRFAGTRVIKLNQ